MFETVDELECLDAPRGECAGTVELREEQRGADSWKAFPRCETHWELRLVEIERINRLYAPFSDVPPDGFDPDYAGERWKEEDY